MGDGAAIKEIVIGGGAGVVEVDDHALVHRGGHGTLVRDGHGVRLVLHGGAVGNGDDRGFRRTPVAVRAFERDARAGDGP